MLIKPVSAVQSIHAVLFSGGSAFGLDAAGATVGKLNGADDCMKSGIGSYAVQIGELKVGA